MGGGNGARDPKNGEERLFRSCGHGGINQGFTTTELAAAALIDLDIHTLKQATDIDINDFESYNLSKRGLIEQIAPRYRYTYFAHIFAGGYSSGYYFYLWAEVLDKDAFEAFKSSHDICDNELAHSFRYDLLAQGGQRPGMEMYRTFRGADPDKKPMLRARGLLKEEPVVEETEVVETVELPTHPVTPGMAPKTAPAAPLKPVIKK